jgi:hypothetical protein
MASTLVSTPATLINHHHPRVLTISLLHGGHGHAWIAEGGRASAALPAPAALLSSHLPHARSVCRGAALQVGVAGVLGRWLGERCMVVRLQQRVGEPR